MSSDYTHLPGAEFIQQGLSDESEGKTTVESCLVRIASPNLTRAGLIKAPISDLEAELTLYGLLQEQESNPYSVFQSLLRRLCSFESALAQMS